jgi:hypothetical protein
MRRRRALQTGPEAGSLLRYAENVVIFLRFDMFLLIIDNSDVLAIIVDDDDNNNASNARKPVNNTDRVAATSQHARQLPVPKQQQRSTNSTTSNTFVDTSRSPPPRLVSFHLCYMSFNLYNFFLHIDLDRIFQRRSSSSIGSICFTTVPKRVASTCETNTTFRRLLQHLDSESKQYDTLGDKSQAEIEQLQAVSLYCCCCCCETK